MKPPVGSRVTDCFRAHVHDVTPPDLLDRACVLYMPVISDDDVATDANAILPKAEQQRARRFAKMADTAHFALRRAFRRFCGSRALGGQRPLESILFVETPSGRPYLAGCADLSFSFASCRSGMLGAWSAKWQLGIDIEDRTLHVDPSDIAEMFFAASEARAVGAWHTTCRERTLLQFWCLKEAALKSIGKGLPYGLDAFVFDLAPRLRLIDAPASAGGAARFTPYQLTTPTACAALVTHDVR